MFLARRNLLHEPIRFGLSVTGIGLAIMLTLVLLGVLTGVRRQTGAYLAHTPGSVVVTAEGTDSFLLSTTPLPPGTADSVGSVPGVSRVVPLLAQWLVLRLHERREAAFLIGYDPITGGGPRRLAAGRAPATDDEVVLDHHLADRHGIAAGDVVEILGRPFAVSGLADETSPLMTSLVFVRKDALETVILAPGATSVLVVTPEPGLSPLDLRDRLAALPATSALLKDDLIARDVALFTAGFQSPIRLMAAIALLVGTLVVGLLIYAGTVERRREYGVLKAVGIGNRRLYRIIAWQALVTAAAGVAVGLVLAALAARLIMALRPEFLIALTPGAGLLATAAGLVMALAAALAPARVVAGLAPAEVFRR
jgi:putative ABC transport system permease protein